MSVNFDDLSAFDTVTPANSGAWLTLKDAQDTPTNRRLKLLGVNSDVWQSDNYSDADQRQRALAKGGKPVLESARQSDDRYKKRVAKMCIAWEGFKDEAGNDAPCTKENVYAVLTHPRIGLLVFAQALEFILDPANFGESGEKHPDPRQPEEQLAAIAKN